jgi:hypothetical protein
MGLVKLPTSRLRWIVLFILAFFAFSVGVAGGFGSGSSFLLGRSWDSGDRPHQDGTWDGTINGLIYHV